VLVGVAAAIAHLEDDKTPATEDLSSLLSSLSLGTFQSPLHLDIVTPPQALAPGQILLHHPALQLAHSPPSDGFASSKYLGELYRWASESLERIKEKGCEIPEGLNQGDLYLSPGSILAIEGAVCRRVT
jgi:histone deacetylase HOS3